MRDYFKEVELITEVVELLNNKMKSNEINEKFIEIMEEYDIELRQCDCCGNIMYEGHHIDEICEYYCDDECLNKSITKEEQEELYEKDLLFWTSWI